jgi:EAL domain-containing protein (putative c-di-GMP-specific phosphodiesterase class I)/DNA-binding response OmpR family regulator
MIDELASHARPTILVADDNAGIRALFSTVLTTAGFDVITAVDGENAIERLADADADVALLLLDSSMPRLNGLDVIKRVRANELTARLPVILVTGAAAESDRIRGLDGGADDYIAKPVSPSELVARVRAHLRASESWRNELRRSLEIRRSVTALLRRVPREGTPAQTAERAIAELAGLIGVDALALLQPRGGRYYAYAAHGELVDIFPPGSVLEPAVSGALASRAAEGYWVQRLPGRRERAVAYFPFEASGGQLGLLAVADLDEGPMPQRILNRLTDLAEVAELMGGFLGPLAESGAAEVVFRRQVETVIETRAFEAYFQPIVRLRDGEAVAFEALTRFADGRPPDLHFAEARRAGLQSELEMATLAAALRDAELLPAEARLHVNITPARLLDTDRLPELLRRSPRPLVIELTEHEAVGNYAELLAAIHALGPGVEIAIDDAGSGYASLRHIQALRPDTVKLDLQWVHALESDPAIHALVTGLVEFGRQIGCAIVGEGVETDAQHAALISIGVAYGQGYRYGRPAPAAAWAHRPGLERTPRPQAEISRRKTDAPVST